MKKPFHPNDVLLDLLQCRVTSDALADRHQCSTYQITAIMNRHQKDGHVVSIPLCDNIQTWKLTDAGTALAQSLQTPSPATP